MNRTGWAWARLVGAAMTFTVLFWRLGAGPFLDGVRAVDGPALAAAAGLGLLTTVAVPGGGSSWPMVSASTCRCPLP